MEFKFLLDSYKSVLLLHNVQYKSIDPGPINYYQNDGVLVTLTVGLHGSQLVELQAVSV